MFICVRTICVSHNTSLTRLGQPLLAKAWHNVQEEGGREDPGNIQAAARYCEKCIKMQGRWVHWNEMTERLEYLSECVLPCMGCSEI